VRISDRTRRSIQRDDAGADDHEAQQLGLPTGVGLQQDALQVGSSGVNAHAQPIGRALERTALNHQVGQDRFRARQADERSQLVRALQMNPKAPLADEARRVLSTIGE
jgi:hypothetical protein